jgi:regulation of enolase protein 1 (concanavalin A-like superfamily)
MLESIPFDRGKWLNPPAKSQIASDRLMIETAAQTDFWRETHYGFTHSNGHALLFDMPERFAAEVTFSGRFTSKYEQAGLLLWESETRWIKAGIENADGRANLAVVATDGRSDWSMAPADDAVSDWTIRMTATDAAVIIHARRLGSWQILRVANFVACGARIGPMACSPLSAGLQVSFSDLLAGPVPEEPLYI